MTTRAKGKESVRQRLSRAEGLARSLHIENGQAHDHIKALEREKADLLATLTAAQEHGAKLEAAITKGIAQLNEVQTSARRWQERALEFAVDKAKFAVTTPDGRFEGAPELKLEPVQPENGWDANGGEVP